MRISMTPHSGVVAFNFLDQPFPVIGWFSQELENGGMKLVPLVLDRGELVQLDDAKVQYALVGIGPRWFALVEAHNASPTWPAG